MTRPERLSDDTLGLIEARLAKIAGSFTTEWTWTDHQWFSRLVAEVRASRASQVVLSPRDRRLLGELASATYQAKWRCPDETCPECIETAALLHRLLAPTERALPGRDE